jgi:hypothetical protein
MVLKMAPDSGRSKGDVGYLRNITKKPHQMKTLLFLGLVAIGLNATASASGINVGTPLVSGDVSRFVSRQETGRTDLSPKQLQGLANWLKNHQSGWHGMITEASSEPVQLQLKLKHSDGALSSISVIAQANGGHYLLMTGPGKWAYEAFLGFWKSWAATRSLSDQELAALVNVVSAT